MIKKSLSGYKKDSKDKKEPILEIPGGNITMKGVPHNVLAILDDGSTHLMYPEKDYNFNTSKVIEIPLKMNKHIKSFESYLESVDEDNQNNIIDYLDTLSPKEQQKFLKGGATLWSKYQQGGMVPVEVEDKETIMNPDGQLYEFNGKTHAEGGIDIMAEQGSKIFSEYSKAPKELIKTVLGKNTNKKYSYADLSKKFDTTEWTKVLQNPDADEYQKKSAMMKFAGNQSMLELIFQTQEAEKQKQDKNKFQSGGNVPFWNKYTFGNLDEDEPGIYQELTPLQRIQSTYNDLPEVVIKAQKPTYEDKKASKYDLVVTGTEPSTLGNSPNRRTEPVYFGGNQNTDFPNNSNTYDDNNNVIEQIEPIVQPKPTDTGKTKLKPNKTGNNKSPEDSLITIPTELASLPQVDISKYFKGEGFDINDYKVDINQPQNNEVVSNNKKSKFKFDGISPKLAGTILDIGLAMSDILNERPPVYRDLRKSPLFSRFVDFDDKEAGRNFALNVQQIQNSNLPEEVKQARIADLNAQYRDHTAKVAFNNAQRYEQKINQDTEKLQRYIDTNIDQHFQDIERYNQQKARFDLLKDQFMAQRKSRVVNSVRNYLDYVDKTNLQNKILSENYEVNPFTGKIVFKGNTPDALKEQESQIAQYRQNVTPTQNLPNGVVLARTPQGVEILIDSTGKATVVNSKQ